VTKSDANMNDKTNNQTVSEKKDRVLVIGLDGATFDLIKPWADEGYLPTLTRLLKEGAHGSLRSTLPPMTAPAWTSFATGVNPAKHRLYDWVARQPDSYRFQPVTSLDCKAPTIYSLLGDAGRKVCVINVPMTYPPLSVNGVMISGMPAPTANSSITYPETLYDEIIENVGDYILYPDPGQAYSDSGIDDFLQRLYRATDLRSRRWNISNPAQTTTLPCWSSTALTQSAMPCGSSWMNHIRFTIRPRLKNTAMPSATTTYFVDEKLAGIVDSLDDDTTLILMSDHGFGPFHKFIHVNNWLMDQGFMKVKKGPLARSNAWRFGPVSRP
jgi:predicted AlkP superfamily phosphohydrolase/phosphomutase